MKTLLIRVDGDGSIGTGHVMRCLALAQAWHRRGGKAVFCCAILPETLEKRLSGEGFAVVRCDVEPGSLADAENVVRLIAEHEASAVACDGYPFELTFQQIVHGAVGRFLVVTDYPIEDAFACDVILNQNLGSSREDYPALAEVTQSLTGSTYALLRQEFYDLRAGYADTETDFPETQRVLVTLGGADPQGTTAKIIRALGPAVDVGGWQVKVVVGGANPHREDIEAAAAAHAGIELLFDVTDMPALMAWCDLAVSAGGSTVWEFCFLGVPTLLLSIAENQDAIVRAMGESGAGINLGLEADLDPAALAGTVTTLLRDSGRRGAMSQRAQKLVDGQGADRVAAAVAGSAFWLRYAIPSDSDLYFDWVNDIEARRWSLTSDCIDRSGHDQWFASRLASDRCMLLVAEPIAVGGVLGQIRFERDSSGVWVISLFVATYARGRGVAAEMVQLGIQRLSALAEGEIDLKGIVKRRNTPSLKLFCSLGFDETEMGELSIFTKRAQINA